MKKLILIPLLICCFNCYSQFRYEATYNTTEKCCNLKEIEVASKMSKIYKIQNCKQINFYADFKLAIYFDYLGICHFRNLIKGYKIPKDDFVSLDIKEVIEVTLSENKEAYVLIFINKEGKKCGKALDRTTFIELKSVCE